MKRLYVLAITFLFFGIAAVCQENVDFDKYQLLDEISENVKLNFYETTFDSIAWNQNVDNYRLQLSNVKTLDSFDLLINELLSSLKTSHTYYFSRNNPKRYQLLGVFDAIFGSSDTTFYHYEGIGIDTKTIAGKIIRLVRH